MGVKWCAASSSPTPHPAHGPRKQTRYLPFAISECEVRPLGQLGQNEEGPFEVRRVKLCRIGWDGCLSGGLVRCKGPEAGAWWWVEEQQADSVAGVEVEQESAQGRSGGWPEPDIRLLAVEAEPQNRCSTRSPPLCCLLLP